MENILAAECVRASGQSGSSHLVSTVEVTSRNGCWARVADARVVLLMCFLQELCLTRVMRPCKPSVRALPKW